MMSRTLRREGLSYVSADTGTRERVKPLVQDGPLRSAPVYLLTPARSVTPESVEMGASAMRGSVYCAGMVSAPW
jgi:hypothetical protein